MLLQVQAFIQLTCFRNLMNRTWYEKEITAETVQRTGTDCYEWLARNKKQAGTSAIFLLLYSFIRTLPPVTDYLSFLKWLECTRTIWLHIELNKVIPVPNFMIHFLDSLVQRWKELKLEFKERISITINWLEFEIKWIKFLIHFINWTNGTYCTM